MKKILLVLTATFAVCLAVFAGTNMCVKKQNGEILRINIDDVYEVYFEDIFNPDTSAIIPPFIEPTVTDTSAYAPLRFEITSDSTVELTYGNYRDLDSVNIPAKVKIDGKVYSVTSIGMYAFDFSSSLTSVEIPSSVTEIGKGAFHQCRNLASINIPSSVTEIGEGAFISCYKLIPELLIYNNGTKCFGWIGDSLKCVEVVIPEGVKSIDRNAFFGCKNLAKVFIPSSVTEIGSEAFYNCSSLTSIEIPSSVTSIGSSAFYWCDNLDIVIDNSKENVKFYRKRYDWNQDMYIVEETTMEESYAFYGVKSVTWLKEIDEDPSVADVSAYAPLRFRITSNSTAELTRGENWESYRNLDSVNIPAKVKIDGKVYSVTSIGWSAFEECRSLTSVNIPESVTSIEMSAFEECRSLESINVDAKNSNYSSLDGILYNKDKTEIIKVPEGIKGSFSIPSSVTSIGEGAFYGCSSLTSVEIPSSVTSIGDDAFYGCSSLTSVEIPSSVTSIGEGAFYGCWSLESINVDAKNPNYSSLDGVVYNKEKTEIIAVPEGIKGSISIPSSVTEIGERAFYSCSSLTSVEIPSSVTSIGSEAFRFCSSLTSVEIPSSVTSIGDDAFVSCHSLTSVEIPSSVTSIGDDAFVGCSSLTSVEIPSSVTSIGSDAFGDCSSLESINVDAKNPNYSSLDGILYNKDKTEIIAVPKGIKGSFSIPSSVTSIGGYAFDGCSLTSVEIPSSVTSIGKYAFYYCRSLTSVEIPSSVTSIGKYAFAYCENLDIVIDNSEENVKVDHGAFYDVKSVKWLK